MTGPYRPTPYAGVIRDLDKELKYGPEEGHRAGTEVKAHIRAEDWSEG